jgi:hypothetical protein
MNDCARVYLSFFQKREVRSRLRRIGVSQVALVEVVVNIDIAKAKTALLLGVRGPVDYPDGPGKVAPSPLGFILEDTGHMDAEDSLRLGSL